MDLATKLFNYLELEIGYTVIRILTYVILEHL